MAHNDEKEQGKGIGRTAFAEIINLIKSQPLGQGKLAVLSCTIGNEIAEKLYLSFGFENTQYVFDDERVMSLKLS